MDIVFHITTRATWEATANEPTYQADSLNSEGFIHCSTLAQLLIPANELFRGQEGLILLCIDPNQVGAPIVYEDCYQTGDAFPHIYGPLQTAAVIQVVDFPSNADGTFHLPPAVAQLGGIS